MYIIFLKTLPTTSKEGNPRVPMVLWVLFDTAPIRGTVRVYPAAGTVFGSTGTVWGKAKPTVYPY